MLRFYLLTTGGAFIAYGSIVAYARAVRLSRWATAEGVVVSSVERPDSDDVSTIVHFARIAFLTADGRRFEFISSVGGTRALVLGRVVCVKYDPDDPNHAVEDTVVAKWGFTTVVLLLGVICLTAALLSRSS